MTPAEIDILRKAGCSAEQITRVLMTELEQRRHQYFSTKDLSGTFFVYCLCDPRRGKKRTPAPFYVGISKNPFARFEQHSRDFASCAFHTVRQFLDCGFQRDQILKIYKKCSNRAEALALEFKLISTVPGLLNRDRRQQTYFGQGESS